MAWVESDPTGVLESCAARGRVVAEVDYASSSERPVPAVRAGMNDFSTRSRKCLADREIPAGGACGDDAPDEVRGWGLG